MFLRDSSVSNLFPCLILSLIFKLIESFYYLINCLTRKGFETKMAIDDDLFSTTKCSNLNRY
jgi:hypothetical protein